MSKKSSKTESSTGLKNRSVYDMLKNAADKKKEGQMKKNTEPIQQKKSTYKKKPVIVKTLAQAEKDLMKSLLAYKKSSPGETHINIIFMPTHNLKDES